jgi:hypothetical protein
MIAIGYALAPDTYGKYKIGVLLLFYFSGFLGPCPDRTARRSNTLNGSNDAVWCKETPLGRYTRHLRVK